MNSYNFNCDKQINNYYKIFRIKIFSSSLILILHVYNYLNVIQFCFSHSTKRITLYIISATLSGVIVP